MEEQVRIKKLQTPVTKEEIESLCVGDQVYLSGKIFCGRDAVLPKICSLIDSNSLKEYGIDLEGSLIFHTAVSPAGIGPTSSNKVEIEGSFEKLSKGGVRIHLGKGQIKDQTVSMLGEQSSCFAIIPPVTALLKENTISTRCAAFPELGMEAFYELEVKDIPMIIAAVNGNSIFRDGSEKYD